MATLHGQIRRAGQGVPGLRVVGYEEIQMATRSTTRHPANWVRPPWSTSAMTSRTTPAALGLNTRRTRIRTNPGSAG